MFKKGLRKVRRVEDRFYSSGIDRNDGDYDTGQEQRGKLVDIFDPHKNNHSHEAQTNRAIHPHIIQHCTAPWRMKYCRLRNQIFLWMRK